MISTTWMVVARAGIVERFVELLERPVAIRRCVMDDIRNYRGSRTMPVKSCTHDGFHSGEGRYDPSTSTLHYVVVCDSCQAIVREVAVQPYAPVYNAHGNDPYVTF